jgi:hypothetical protein
VGCLEVEFPNLSLSLSESRGEIPVKGGRLVTP